MRLFVGFKILGIDFIKIVEEYLVFESCRDILRSRKIRY